MARKIINGVSFVGIAMGIQRRVVESVANKEELEDFHKLCIKYEELDPLLDGGDYERQKLIRNKLQHVSAKKCYYRKLWRTKYSKQMEPGLYKVCKHYGRYDYHNTLNGGEGTVQECYTTRKSPLLKNSLIMFSHHDSIGNVHFVTCGDNRTIAFRNASSVIDHLERMPDA